MIVIVIISSVIACTLAWYMSMFNYALQHTSQLWLLGDRPFWVGRQIDFGFFSFGFLCCLCCTGLLCCFRFGILPKSWIGKGEVQDVDDEDEIAMLVIAPIMCAAVWGIGYWCILATIASPFGWGFGFGYGWQFGWISSAATAVCGLGVGMPLFILGMPLFIWIRASERKARMKRTRMKRIEGGSASSAIDTLLQLRKNKNTRAGIV